MSGKADSMLELVLEGVLLLSILPALTAAYVTYSSDANASAAAVAIAVLIELILIFGFIRYAWARASKLK